MERLSADVKTKIIGFGEYKMGAHNVDLVLRDGRIIQDVTVVWGDEIVRVGASERVDFDPHAVIDAVSRRWPSPRATGRVAALRDERQRGSVVGRHLSDRSRFPMIQR